MSPRPVRRTGPLWVATGLLLGVLIHLVAILAIPSLAARTGQQRLAEMVGNRAGFLPIPDEADLPGRDPALQEAACRYDVERRRVRIEVPAEQSLVSLVLVPETGPPYLALSPEAASNGRLVVVLDREGPHLMTGEADAETLPNAELDGTLRLRLPQPRGFVILRWLRTPGNTAAPLADAARCGRDHGL